LFVKKPFQRRRYEQVALVAVRKTRQLVLFWARRCRKSTTLGNIAFAEMSGEAGRTVIAASASLLLGRELVGMTLSATEQAALVAVEAGAVRQVFESEAAEKGLDLKVADASQDKILTGLTAEDFADLYKSSNMELRLYFSRTLFSRLKIIAPNPATARGWGGTVLRDEAGYTPVSLETDLRVAVKPIMDTDPAFKLIYACNLCPNDRHPFFEMTMPPPDACFPANANGHFYRGQDGILIHRVSLADAYAAGHLLYDDLGKPLTLEEFRKAPGNRLGLSINYDLIHEAGGTAVIDLISLLSAQRRGAGQCHFVFVDCENDWQNALDLLSGSLGTGKVGLGLDLASTTGDTSNPTSLTLTERNGTGDWQRLVAVWKTKKRLVTLERIEDVLRIVRARPGNAPARRLCVDATNDRLAAEETADDLRGKVPTELVIASISVQPPGYDEPTNYKTYLGDRYAASVNDGVTALPPDAYVKLDHRLPMKDQGRYLCNPDMDGRHGDTFDSGKLAEYALTSAAGAITPEAVQQIHTGAKRARRPGYRPHKLPAGAYVATGAFA
jgi:hypothetical protein